MKKNAWVFCLCTLSFLSSFAQTWQQEQRFALQVKQVDEFIERFNGDSSTLLVKYQNEHFSDRPLDRIALIKTLFNQQNPRWDYVEVEDFIDAVTGGAYPVHLDFFDADWYARLNCQVKYKGLTHSIVLTLKVQKEANNASKWVISGVNAGFLKFNSGKHQDLFLNPVSHGTDFINLRMFFNSDKKYLGGFLHDEFENDELTLFVHELRKGNITLVKINEINYHFLQVPGWGFTVNKFQRDASNSGWLISSLNRMTEQQKQIYKTDYLFLD